VEFFITSALVLGLLVVPGLINYFFNRWFGPAAESPPKLELLAASLSLTFVIIVLDVLTVLLISLGWDGLKEQIQDFVRLGLAGFGEKRPIALSGVLAAVSVAYMALMALLGTFRIPGRYLR
jgi:hypothetical protein